MRTPGPATTKSFGNKHHFERDVISLLTSQAEQEAGYSPHKVGWLPWFGKVLRSESDLLLKLRDTAKSWPPLEREIFELYFVDRHALVDIAIAVGCTAKAFHTHLLFIQRRLREALVQEVLAESKPVAVDGWTLRLKRRCCGNDQAQNAMPAMDQS